MKGNITSNEQKFRIVIGILLMLPLIFKGTYGTYLYWVIAIILIVTGIFKYCPAYNIFK